MHCLFARLDIRLCEYSGKNTVMEGEGVRILTILTTHPLGLNKINIKVLKKYSYLGDISEGKGREWERVIIHFATADFTI